MAEVATEAERDGRDRHQVGDQHQPAGQEADPGPEGERGVLELGRVERAQGAEPRVGVGGERG